MMRWYAMVSWRRALPFSRSPLGPPPCYARCETCSRGVRENSGHKPVNANSPIESGKISDVAEYVQDEYVQDPSDRWRHVYEPQKEIKSILDDQVLLEQYAMAVADACTREKCLEDCVENGESLGFMEWPS